MVRLDLRPNISLLKMLKTGLKVWGGWWWVVVVVLTPNLVFCFGPKLWFWPRPKLNKKPTAGKL